MAETILWGGEDDEGHARPTGQEIFDGMTTAEQDEQFGPEKAQALRDGTITLADLVQVDRSPESYGEDFITEKPMPELKEEP